MKIEQVVSDYYHKIDNQDIDWVLNIFAENSCYIRADSTYKGKAAISEFYTQQRKIVGQHSIKNITVNKNLVVAVNGEFNGSGIDGSKKQIGFSDFWTFNEKAKVILRETYLATGSSYVKS